MLDGSAILKGVHYTGRIAIIKMTADISIWSKETVSIYFFFAIWVILVLILGGLSCRKFFIWVKDEQKLLIGYEAERDRDMRLYTVSSTASIGEPVYNNVELQSSADGVVEIAETKKDVVTPMEIPQKRKLILE